MDLDKLKKEQKIDIHLYLSRTELDALDALKAKYDTSRSRLVGLMATEIYNKTFKE